VAGGLEVGEVLGVGLGLGLVVGVAEAVGLGLVLALGLALPEDVLALGVALGLVLGLALLVALSLGDALLLAEALLALAACDGATAASRTASLGSEEHSVLAVVPAVDATASAVPKAAEVMKARPETAAITAGLRSCVLTLEPRSGADSASCSFRPDRPEPS
jgi:hypothetical protein